MGCGSDPPRVRETRPQPASVGLRAPEIRHLLRLVGSGADAVRAFTVIVMVGAVLGLLAAHFLGTRESAGRPCRDAGAGRYPVAAVLAACGREPYIDWGWCRSRLGRSPRCGLARGPVVVGAQPNPGVLCPGDGEALLVLTVLGLRVFAALPATIRAARSDVTWVLSGG